MWKPEMNRLLLALLFLFGCGADAVDPMAYVGTWDLAVQPGNCGPGLDLHFTIDQGDADAATSELINIVSVWWYPATGVTSQLTGNISWLDNEFDLRFHAASGGQGSFTGSGSSATSLTGTFSDPGGDFWAGTNCTADATATKP